MARTLPQLNDAIAILDVIRACICRPLANAKNLRRRRRPSDTEKTNLPISHTMSRSTNFALSPYFLTPIRWFGCLVLRLMRSSNKRKCFLV